MDIARLTALWYDRTLTTTDVAKQMGIHLDTLYKLAQRHGLPRRKAARRRIRSIDDGTDITLRDPTPSEIERMKEELFQKRLQKLRNESSEETTERLLRERKRFAEAS